MMHVVIHDDDPFHAERERMRGRGGHAVVQAESHRPIALGVMARRPDQRHHARCARLNDRLDSANRRAGGEQRDVARVRRRVSVGIERRRPARSRVNGGEMGVAVHSPQLGVRGRARRLDDAPTLLPCVGDAVHHLGALHALGMPGRRTVIAEPIGVNEDK